MAQLINPAGDNKVIAEKKVLNKEGNTVEYEITVNGALQKEIYEKLFDVRAKDVEIKGFRKGEAPRTAVEPQLYGDLVKDLSNVLVNNAIEELITDNDIVTLTMPEVSNITFTMVETPMKFVVKILELPQYKIPDLKKYVVKLAEPEITEEEIEKAYKTIWEDWVKKVKDEEMKKKYTEPTDEWVATVLNIPKVKTVEDLKKLIKEELTHQKYHQEEDKKLGEIIDQLIQDMKIEVPEKVAADAVEETMKSQIEKTKKYGLTWEDYLKRYNKTEEEFKKEVEESFTKQYKEEVFWTFYIRHKQIKINPQSQDDSVFINYAAANMGIQPNDKLDQNQINRILRTASMYKAVDTLREDLGIVEPDEIKKMHKHNHDEHDHEDHDHNHDDAQE